MLVPFNHRPVNWVDGMKISKKHFVQSDEFVTDALRDINAIRLTDYNYGLLPAHSKQLESLEMLVSSDYSREINIKLVSCRAVTADGNRIEVVKNTNFVYHITLNKFIAEKNIAADKEQYFYIVVSVNHFDRVPFGEPDPVETPPRHPYTEPSMFINVVPVNQITHTSFNSSHLIIGKMFFNGSEIRHIPVYVPPCMSVSSHQQLLEWYENFKRLLNFIGESCIKIIHKVKQKSQKNSLAESTYYLVEKFLYRLNESKPYFQNIISKDPPISFINYLTGFVHNINTSFSLLLDKDKEELLSYFGEWTDLTPGVLDAKIHEAVQLNYDHLDITNGFQQLHGFYTLLAGLFSKLSQLEYIGKRKGAEVFIKEASYSEMPIEKPKSRFSPL